MLVVAEEHISATEYNVAIDNDVASDGNHSRTFMLLTSNFR